LPYRLHDFRGYFKSCSATDLTNISTLRAAGTDDLSCPVQDSSLMALNALITDPSALASSSAQPVEADPLPPKRGEFGFREEVHGQAAEEGARVVSAEVVDLPARHPADREPPTDESARDSPPEPVVTTAPTTTPSTTPPPHESTPSTSKSRIKTFFDPQKLPSYGGIQSATLLIVIAQFLLVGATITAWVFSVKRNDGDGDGYDFPEVGVILHVMFGIALLGQLIMLERRIFRLRAERYAFLHPGEMLPTSRRLSSTSTNMGIAPWHRPPLPTYAAALAASGHGTGDVEDHIIAAPPPPAYGNTRGSTLILAGFLRESLRAQRPRSTSSQASVKSERPLSYHSQDESHGTHREVRLEETLARLEEGGRV